MKGNFVGIIQVLPGSFSSTRFTIFSSEIYLYLYFIIEYMYIYIQTEMMPAPQPPKMPPQPPPFLGGAATSRRTPSGGVLSFATFPNPPIFTAPLKHLPASSTPKGCHTIRINANQRGTIGRKFRRGANHLRCDAGGWVFLVLQVSPTPRFNIGPKILPSQKQSCLPTIIFS